MLWNLAEGLPSPQGRRGRTRPVDGLWTLETACTRTLALSLTRPWRPLACRSSEASRHRRHTQFGRSRSELSTCASPSPLSLRPATHSKARAAGVYTCCRWLALYVIGRFIDGESLPGNEFSRASSPDFDKYKPISLKSILRSIIEFAALMQVPDISSFGSVVHIDRGTAVLKIPMNGSYAVPLGVLDPASVDLVSWSFYGFAGQRVTDPSCFLVLACQDGGTFCTLSSVSVRTHFGDRCVALTSGMAPLSRAETSIVAKALVSALTPGNLAHLCTLLPILDVGLDAILAESDAAAPNIRRGDSTNTWLTHKIDFVPDCMIVRSSAGYACSPLTAVRFHASHPAAVAFTTGISLNTQRADGAILSGNGRYVAARVTGAM